MPLLGEVVERDGELCRALCPGMLGPDERIGVLGVCRDGPGDGVPVDEPRPGVPAIGRPAPGATGARPGGGVAGERPTNRGFPAAGTPPVTGTDGVPVTGGAEGVGNVPFPGDTVTAVPEDCRVGCPEPERLGTEAPETLRPNCSGPGVARYPGSPGPVARSRGISLGSGPLHSPIPEKRRG